MDINIEDMTDEEIGALLREIAHRNKAKDEMRQAVRKMFGRDDGEIVPLDKAFPNMGDEG